MPENKKLTERIHALTTPSQKRKLDNAAHAKKISQGEIIRQALEMIFAEYEGLERRGDK